MPNQRPPAGIAAECALCHGANNPGSTGSLKTGNLQKVGLSSVYGSSQGQCVFGALLPEGTLVTALKAFRAAAFHEFLMLFADPANDISYPKIPGQGMSDVGDRIDLGQIARIDQIYHKK
ncbi:hypothetical protein P5W99_38040 [Paraburkholderia sp. A3BS-1L]|uniref:hypothetical protein n=1 Tax=Paraburkholderia sp. A3BS-1L TaxID=3028375 RepID=UPI003DA890D8